MIRGGIVAALVAGALPQAAAAYDLGCPVRIVCEGRSCHKAEAGLKLQVLVEQADGVAPVLISDSGPFPAHGTRTDTGWRFQGRNAMGANEVLVADLTAGTFAHLRKGTAVGFDITYQGTFTVGR